MKPTENQETPPCPFSLPLYIPTGWAANPCLVCDAKGDYLFFTKTPEQATYLVRAINGAQTHADLVRAVLSPI